ncbi:hypothetical protein QGM71_02805 [Virgibacillus sp. C22-A2]|uniref:Uncharacterized protein n=1 Tax=Virgibacillus tibetensis TaxID=3042313 RepID=A0ABU6KB67_9BACI|nr:hypothetical protein [Virgibacillus sp. C22-A2]
MKKILVVVGLMFLVGCSEATAEVEGEAMNLEELQGNIKDAGNELKDVENKITSKEADLKNLENKYNSEVDGFEEIVALIDDKESIESDVKSAESTLAKLNDDIGSAEKELAKLQGDILESVGSPIEINAGQWFVGTDIDPGRYRASGSSNFVVRDSGGSLVVNTILGDGRSGRGDYVFFAVDEYYIETSAKTTLTPVE